MKAHNSNPDHRYRTRVIHAYLHIARSDSDASPTPWPRELGAALTPTSTRRGAPDLSHLNGRRVHTAPRPISSVPCPGRRTLGAARV